MWGEGALNLTGPGPTEIPGTVLDPSCRSTHTGTLTDSRKARPAGPWMLQTPLKTPGNEDACDLREQTPSTAAKSVLSLPSVSLLCAWTHNSHCT